MQNLITALLSFYPAIFIYNQIVAYFGKNIKTFADTATSSFIVNLIIFAVVYFVAYKVFRRYLSFTFVGKTKRGALGLIITSILTLALAFIAFYTYLPGALVYPAPLFVQHYVLVQPYLLIALIVPFIYLFID